MVSSGISRDIFRSNSWSRTGANAWNLADDTLCIFGPGKPLRGIHNSIGCRLIDQALGTGTRLEFPAHYAGNLAITLSMMGTTGSSFISGTTDAEPPMAITPSGNIQPIRHACAC